MRQEGVGDWARDRGIFKKKEKKTWKDSESRGCSTQWAHLEKYVLQSITPNEKVYLYKDQHSWYIWWSNIHFNGQRVENPNKTRQVSYYPRVQKSAERSFTQSARVYLSL